MRERILPLDFRFSEATGISDPTRPRSSIFTTNKNILLKRTRKESTSSITRLHRGAVHGALGYETFISRPYAHR